MYNPNYTAEFSETDTKCKTDNLMQQIIRDEFRDCTIIAIADRLDTIMDFDRIAVMHIGHIVECDSLQALLAKDTAFKRLYEGSNTTQM
jgi:ATP-binding cassette, subfamily C (CFTR/MRP), member 1